MSEGESATGSKRSKSAVRKPLSRAKEKDANNSDDATTLKKKDTRRARKWPPSYRKHACDIDELKDFSSIERTRILMDKINGVEPESK